MNRAGPYPLRTPHLAHRISPPSPSALLQPNPQAPHLLVLQHLAVHEGQVQKGALDGQQLGVAATGLQGSKRARLWIDQCDNAGGRTQRRADGQRTIPCSDRQALLWLHLWHAHPPTSRPLAQPSTRGSAAYILAVPRKAFLQRLEGSGAEQSRAESSSGRIEQRHALWHKLICVLAQPRRPCSITHRPAVQHATVLPSAPRPRPSPCPPAQLVADHDGRQRGLGGALRRPAVVLPLNQCLAVGAKAPHNVSIDLRASHEPQLHLRGAVVGRVGCLPAVAEPG